ncbi:MAG: DUF1801 domain-containing protein [Planctomycetes bacterium]|nr:DUF1801 domain-containing protein [Planctomycetota bacterium]
MPTRKPKGSKRPVKETVGKRIQAKVSPRTDAPDWRLDTLARMRVLIYEADPQVVEEQKWKKPTNPSGVPVWSHDGIICTGEIYKDKVKLTFMHGAALADPAGLFPGGQIGGTRRALDIREGEHVDARAFQALIRAAVAWNRAKAKKK